MLPNKLFSPKCLHPDRNIVFKDDLHNFYLYILHSLQIMTEKDEIEKLNQYTYKNYKSMYQTKRISMLHFSRSKEENPKEYYEVLFGEVQYIFFTSHINSFIFIPKLFSIYTLYSLYYTQISREFYQINTIPEYLQGLNELITKLYNINKTITYEIYLMVSKLKKDNAFSIGVIPGLKTIMLNKYGLPLEQKTNVYQDYLDIFSYNKEEENKEDNYDDIIKEYSEIKKEIVDQIKVTDIDKEDYVSYLNENYVDNSKADETEKITAEDLTEGKVTNFDCLFNKLL